MSTEEKKKSGGQRGLRVGSGTWQILELLKEEGPMTTREVTFRLGTRMNDTARNMSTLHRGGYIHVRSYRRDESGGRLYPRAVFEAGPGREAPKPKRLTRSETNARYHARKSKFITSVFDLGRPIEGRRIRHVKPKAEHEKQRNQPVGDP